MKKPPRAEEEVTANLIPMIDIMFLLLLFFMLGADMGHRELEEVRLPEAKAAAKEAEGRVRTIVNVHHADDAVCAPYAADGTCADETHWRLGVRGVVYTTATLPALLTQEAALEPLAGGRSARVVLVRADAAARYGVVQTVLGACAAAGIDRVELAARRSDS